MISEKIFGEISIKITDENDNYPVFSQVKKLFFIVMHCIVKNINISAFELHKEVFDKNIYCISCSSAIKENIFGFCLKLYFVSVI